MDFKIIIIFKPDTWFLKMFLYFSKCFIDLHFKSTYFWVNFLCKGKILFFFFFCLWIVGYFNNISFFNFLTFYFVSGYSRLTMLWQFQVNNKGTQTYIYMYPFSPKLPSLPGCHITLSRGPYSTQFLEKRILSVSNCSCYLVRNQLGIFLWFIFRFSILFHRYVLSPH